MTVRPAEHAPPKQGCEQSQGQKHGNRDPGRRRENQLPQGVIGRAPGILGCSQHQKGLGQEIADRDQKQAGGKAPPASVLGVKGKQADHGKEKDDGRKSHKQPNPDG